MSDAINVCYNNTIILTNYKFCYLSIFLKYYLQINIVCGIIVIYSICLENFMIENNIFISEIYNIGCDFLTTKKSFIPTIPRKFHALAYIIDGQIRYTVENRSYTTKSGEVLFIRSGYIDLSQVENCEKVSYITVDFSTVNDDFTLDYRTQLRDSDEVRGLFEKMQTVWTSLS